MALVVEDGTGLSTANSYVTTAYLDAYAALVGKSSTLSGKTSDEKDEACIVASQYLEALYGHRVKGQRAVSDQALLFPRLNLVTWDGEYLDGNVVPKKWKDATCEGALRHITETDGLMPDDDQRASIAAESVKVGPITESIKYVGGKTSLKKFHIIEGLVREYLRGGSRIVRA